MPPEDDVPIPHQPLPEKKPLPLEDLPSAQPTALSPDSILRTAQNVLTLVVGAGAVVTASGFIIVNTYLAQYTDIHDYGIVPGQYLAAGVGLWVIILLFILGIVVVLRIASYASPYATATLKGSALADFSQSPFQVLKTTIFRVVSRIGLIAAIAAYTLVGGYFYGRYMYGAISRYLGGGKPTTIYLVLKNALDIGRYGLYALPGQDNVTGQVQLLAELSDGILIYNYVKDPIPDYAAIIKNDEIAGILDEQSLAQIEDVGATQKAEPTPEATGSS